ncbi:MAG: Gfo/Idh/MocA family oxidoreductase, partial [Acidimicrobiia bacterium]
MWLGGLSPRLGCRGQCRSGCSPVAVSDPDIQRAEEVAGRFNAEAAYESYGELLKRDDISAVSVCVP